MGSNCLDFRLLVLLGGVCVIRKFDVAVLDFWCELRRKNTKIANIRTVGVLKLIKSYLTFPTRVGADPLHPAAAEH